MGQTGLLITKQQIKHQVIFPKIITPGNWMQLKIITHGLYVRMQLKHIAMKNKKCEYYTSKSNTSTKTNKFKLCC